MNRQQPLKDTLRRYMEIRSAYAPAFSCDNREMLFLCTISGTPQVWSLGPESPWPKQLTFFSDRVMDGFPSPTVEKICIRMDQGGNERAQLFLMGSDGQNLENISQDPDHIYLFGAWSPDGRRFSYSSNRRDSIHFDIYQYDIDSASHRLLHQSDHTNYAGQFSPDGGKLLFSRHHTNADNDLYLLEIETGEITLLTPHDRESVFHHACFAKDGKSLYLLSNRDSEFTRVAHLYLDREHWVWLTDDRWDAENLTLSPNGNALAFSLNIEGTSRIAIWDCKASQSIALPEIPQGFVMDLEWNRESSALAFTLSSPRYANEIWQLDLRKNHLLRRTYASISGIPQERFIQPEWVHFPSFDDLSIPAFYYRPNHQKTPYPVLVWVHGGPESQSRNSFNSLIQFFLQQGIAVFVPNVRGSDGYGRTYVHLDDVRKRMDSVADLAKGVEWLVSHGDADKKSIAVMGGSYGGFMVLAALTHYPDLWAAGVDIVGIANLRTFIQNTSPYRRHLRESEYGTVERDGCFFDTISPIHHVDKIKAPLFVIHGANDPRVPVDEAEQIVRALRKRSHPVDYLRFEDEGHGLVKLENKVKAYGEVAKFLDRWLLNEM
ncbi:S9 family peptidase [Salinithrix halophila]|uniref:S9 family peptidase n=1 Tax=Salinithrix halophila TaxID=1485204 RepID=A0ABV8JCJ4_9BACL